MKYWISEEERGLLLKAWSDQGVLFDRRKKKVYRGWSDLDTHGRILAFKPKDQLVWSLEDGSQYSASDGGPTKEISEGEVVEILSGCSTQFLLKQYPLNLIAPGT